MNKKREKIRAAKNRNVIDEQRGERIAKYIVSLYIVRTAARAIIFLLRIHAHKECFITVTSSQSFAIPQTTCAAVAAVSASA